MLVDFDNSHPEFWSKALANGYLRRHILKADIQRCLDAVDTTYKFYRDHGFVESSGKMLFKTLEQCGKSNAGDDLFKVSDALHMRQMADIQKGRLCDPDGVEVYVNIGSDDSPVYLTMRGTSPLEGKHAEMVRELTSCGTMSFELADLRLLFKVFRDNIDAAVKNRKSGFGYGDYNMWRIESIKTKLAYLQKPDVFEKWKSLAKLAETPGTFQEVFGFAAIAEVLTQQPEPLAPGDATSTAPPPTIVRPVAQPAGASGLSLESTDNELYWQSLPADLWATAPRAAGGAAGRTRCDGVSSAASSSHAAASTGSARESLSPRAARARSLGEHVDPEASVQVRSVHDIQPIDPNDANDVGLVALLLQTHSGIHRQHLLRSAVVKDFNHAYNNPLLRPGFTISHGITELSLNDFLKDSAKSRSIVALRNAPRLAAAWAALDAATHPAPVDVGPAHLPVPQQIPELPVPQHEDAAAHHQPECDPAEHRQQRQTAVCQKCLKCKEVPQRQVPVKGHAPCPRRECNCQSCVDVGEKRNKRSAAMKRRAHDGPSP